MFPAGSRAGGEKGRGGQQLAGGPCLAACSAGSMKGPVGSGLRGRRVLTCVWPFGGHDKAGCQHGTYGLLLAGGSVGTRRPALTPCPSTGLSQVPFSPSQVPPFKVHSKGDTFPAPSTPTLVPLRGLLPSSCHMSASLPMVASGH